jgi:Co/Zn/Cd efflux system component
MILKILEIIIISIIISVIIIAFFMSVIRKAFNIINEITPDVDEIKEILRGNIAVSEYFSRIVSATIIGISIIFSVVLLISFSLLK